MNNRAMRRPGKKSPSPSVSITSELLDQVIELQGLIQASQGYAPSVRAVVCASLNQYLARVVPQFRNLEAAQNLAEAVKQAAALQPGK